MDCFVFDWGEFSEAALAASAVVFRFDPVNDFVAELVAGVPGAGVQNVLLEQ